MKTRHAIGPMGLTLAALVAGCGGSRDSTEKQLAELRAELVKVRADSAVLSERLDTLELSRDGSRTIAPRSERDEPSPAEESADRPALTVVRLAPEASGPRPVLRSLAGGAVIEEQPNGAPPSQQPSTPSRRKP